MNTAEVIGAEVCATAGGLAVAIGYPWLWLHYAHKGVLRLGRPTQAKGALTGGTDSAVAAVEREASAATAVQNQRRDATGRFPRTAPAMLPTERRSA